MKFKLQILYAFYLIFVLFLPNSIDASRGLKIVSIKTENGTEIGFYKGSYALLIGISKYSSGWPSLLNIPNELHEIEVVLKNSGFTVETITDPDDKNLRESFKKFIDRYGYNRDNRLLFFYSGHGYSRMSGTKGYLVPSNAPDPRNNEIDFLRKSLSMSQILTWAREMEAKHALFLFDSCFSGTIFKTRALPEQPPYISYITCKPVRQFITAGDAGEEVPAKSVFTPLFIRAINGEADLTNDGYITGTELGLFLREKVKYYNAQQTPQYGKIRDPNLDQGDFVFLVQTQKIEIPTPVPIDNSYDQKISVYYFRKSSDPNNLIELLQSNGYNVITKDSSVNFTNNNSIWFGQNVPFDDVKKISKLVVSAGIKLRGIGISKSADKVDKIQIGYSAKNNKFDPITLDDIDSYQNADNLLSFQRNRLPPRRINILFFNANELIGSEMKVAQFLKKRFTELDCTTQRDWYAKSSYPVTQIVYIQESFRNDAMKIEKLLPGLQDVVSYDEKKKYGYRGLEERDIVIFVGIDLQNITFN